MTHLDTAKHRNSRDEDVRGQNQALQAGIAIEAASETDTSWKRLRWLPPRDLQGNVLEEGSGLWQVSVHQTNVPSGQSRQPSQRVPSGQSRQPSQLPAPSNPSSRQASPEDTIKWKSSKLRARRDLKSAETHVSNIRLDNIAEDPLSNVRLVREVTQEQQRVESLICHLLLHRSRQ